MKKRVIFGESKPDEHTLLLLHFDGDFKDSSKNNYTITSSASFQEGKFGQAAGESDIVMPDNIFHDLLLSDEYTIDYWFKSPPESTIHNVLLGWNGDRGGLTSAVRIFCTMNEVHLYLGYNSGNNPGYRYDKTINNPTTGFHHVAFVRNGNRFMLFYDGVVVINITNNNTSVLGSDRTKNIITWMDGKIIDEFRISNIARWTSNFQVPTKPY